MNEDRLGKALRELPRAAVSPSFTATVVARARALSDQPRRRLTGVHFGILAAAAIAVAITIPLLRQGPTLTGTRSVAIESTATLPAAVEPSNPPSAPVSAAIQPEVARQERVREMRNEYAELRQELFNLQRLAAEQRPVVGIEGADNDYVIDLRNLYTPESRMRRSSGSVPTPASYRP